MPAYIGDWDKGVLSPFLWKNKVVLYYGVREKTKTATDIFATEISMIFGILDLEEQMELCGSAFRLLGALGGGTLLCLLWNISIYDS